MSVFSPMTEAQARQVIADYIDRAYRQVDSEMSSYNEWSGDPTSAGVASEILFQFENENGQLPCGPENLALIEGLLEAEGGPRAYQCKYQFTMRIGQ